TLFRSLGGICFIEVDTDPVTLGAARLYAKNDGVAAFFRRAMQGFKLLADTDGDGVFETTLVDKQIDPDYDLEPDNLATQSEFLELAFEFAPVTSSAWRLEFEQGASVPPFEGMRIIEVDGFPADACYPDCDGSGTLDFFDFLCFQNAFALGDPYADCDGTGALDFFDFLCFQNEFAAGCP
ncbi:MAG: GC-type dockerin domain-anchored protein, partial [Phycisphaerales bacterium JB039]